MLCRVTFLFFWMSLGLFCRETTLGRVGTSIHRQLLEAHDNALINLLLSSSCSQQMRRWDGPALNNLMPWCFMDIFLYIR